MCQSRLSSCFDKNLYAQDFVLFTGLYHQLTKVFYGCTDQYFTLFGVTFHAKHAKLKHAKLFIEHNIFDRFQQYMLHFGQSGCGTSMCVCGSGMCASVC